MLPWLVHFGAKYTSEQECGGWYITGITLYGHARYPLKGKKPKAEKEIANNKNSKISWRHFL
jgi:hypothetical protein